MAMTDFKLPAHINKIPTCPTCRATPDEDCRTASGNPRRDWHARRIMPMTLDVDSWRLVGCDPTVTPELEVNTWLPVFGPGGRSVSLSARVGTDRISLGSVPVGTLAHEAVASAEALRNILLDNDFPSLWKSWVETAIARKIEYLNEEAAKYGYRLVKADT